MDLEKATTATPTTTSTTTDTTKNNWDLKWK
jgi:hypothetical protein